MKKGFTVLEVLAFIVISSFMVTAIFNFEKAVHKEYFNSIDYYQASIKRCNFKKTFREFFTGTEKLGIINSPDQIELITDHHDVMIFIKEGTIIMYNFDIYFGSYYVENHVAYFSFYDLLGPFQIEFVGEINEVYF